MSAFPVHHQDFNFAGADSSISIVFLHGTGGDHTAFNPQVEHFRKFARVISVDLRGHGLSASIGPNVSFEIRDFAQDIFELAERLELRNVIVVGHSLGGLIALELASQRPAWLKGVVLIDTATLIPAPVAEAMAPLNEAFAGPGYGDALQAFASQYFFSPLDQSARKVSILKALAAFPKEVFLQIWKSMGNYDTALAASRAQVPALFIHASVPIDLEVLARVYPGIRIEKLQNSGHFAQLEQPGVVNRLIETFLSSLR